MKIKVGLLGSTGILGSHYLSLLQNHPWFELSTPVDASLIFSALPNEVALEKEPPFLEKGCLLISSASCNRDIAPLIIPEINAHHLKKRTQLIAKPNCAVQAFLLPLAPLHKRATIRSLSVTTMQAISGAGKNGLPSHLIHDNVIPYIEGEEEKLETEPLKILEASFPISALCTRVPVLHGHLASVSVSFQKTLTKEEILEIWSTPSSLNLPSAPRFPVLYKEAPDRPQIRLDRDAERGMQVTVGRLRPSPHFDWNFVALSHNALRGGAGGGILIAELLKQEGFLG